MRIILFPCLLTVGLWAQGRTTMESEKIVVAVLPMDAVALSDRQNRTATVTSGDTSVTRTEAPPGLFDHKAPLEAFAEAATQKVVNAFVNLKRVRVVERSALDQVFKEQEFQLTDVASPAEGARLGGLLGASFIVQGQLQQASVVRSYSMWDTAKASPGYTATVELNLRLVNVSTGEITASKDFSATNGFLLQNTPSEAAYWALNDGEKDIVKWLRLAFPVAGFVFEIAKAKKGAAQEVVITCGKNLGVRKGDVFRVYSEQSVEIEGKIVTRSSDVGKLEVKKVEEDGVFSRCSVEKGGGDIVEQFAAGVKLKVVQVKK